MAKLLAMTEEERRKIIPTTSPNPNSIFISPTAIRQGDAVIGIGNPARAAMRSPTATVSPGVATNNPIRIPGTPAAPNAMGTRPSQPYGLSAEHQATLAPASQTYLGRSRTGRTGQGMGLNLSMQVDKMLRDSSPETLPQTMAYLQQQLGGSYDLTKHAAFRLAAADTRSRPKQMSNGEYVRLTSSIQGEATQTKLDRLKAARSERIAGNPRVEGDMLDRRTLHEIEAIEGKGGILEREAQKKAERDIKEQHRQDDETWRESAVLVRTIEWSGDHPQNWREGLKDLDDRKVPINPIHRAALERKIASKEKDEAAKIAKEADDKARRDAADARRDAGDKSEIISEGQIREAATINADIGTKEALISALNERMSILERKKKDGATNPTKETNDALVGLIERTDDEIAARRAEIVQLHEQYANKMKTWPLPKASTQPAAAATEPSTGTSPFEGSRPSVPAAQGKPLTEDEARQWVAANVKSGMTLQRAVDAARAKAKTEGRTIPDI